MRIDEPEHLKLWKRATAAIGPEPICCHTCEHYTKDGKCAIAGAAPPDDHVLIHSAACNDHQFPVPF